MQTLDGAAEDDNRSLELTDFQLLQQAQELLMFVEGLAMDEFMLYVLEVDVVVFVYDLFQGELICDVLLLGS